LRAFLDAKRSEDGGELGLSDEELRVFESALA